MPLTLLWKLLPAIIFILLGAAAFTAGYKYSDAQNEKEKAELIIKAQQDVQAEIDKNHQLSLEYEKKLQLMAGKVKTIVKTVEVEVEKSIYRECVLPSTGVTTINSAVKTLNESREMETVNKTADKLNKDRGKK